MRYRLFACGTRYGATLVLVALCCSVTQGAESNDEPAGGRLFESHCSRCHDSGVQGAPMKSLLRQMTPNAVYNTLTRGAMKSLTRQIPDADLRQIVLYLTSREPTDHEQQSFLVCKKKWQPTRDDGTRVSEGWGIDAANRRFVDRRRAGMSVTDINRLRLAWSFAFPDSAGSRSQPAVAGGAAFVGSQSGAVYALDARTGCLYWKFEAAGEIRGAVIYRSASGSSQQPALYFGDVFANVYAVDARTGRQLWHVRVDEHPAARIAGSPTVFGDRIYVPLGSWGEELAGASPDYICCTFRGSLTAIQRSSGGIVWTRYTIPTVAVEQYRNSLGIPHLGPSGAGIWSAPAVDARRGSIYLTTGNNYSDPVDDNSDAVFALDLAAGTLKWKHQMLPNDVYNDGCRRLYHNEPDLPTCPRNPGPDADFTAAPVLVSLPGGRDVLVAGQKSSDIMALDPNDGHIIWKYRISHDPAPMSGGVWYGMAVEGNTVFVPVIGTERDRSVPMGPATPLDQIYRYSAANGLYALDVSTGAIKWARTADSCEPEVQCKGFVAAPVAIEGAVFAGSIDGYIRAFDTRTGRVLWSFATARKFAAVGGKTARGGAIWGAGAVSLADGMLFVHSTSAGPGGVLLAFSIH
jgi:polyvinyl alcohol dehydrogenase (cytochrome)